jgi:hypothetical protein
MKGKCLVVISTDNKTVYVPLSRLLRIEAVPAPGPGHVPTVVIVFEGDFQVTVQTSSGEETNVAQNLYERLVPADDIDLTYLRTDPEKNIQDIRIGAVPTF